MYLSNSINACLGGNGEISRASANCYFHYEFAHYLFIILIIHFVNCHK